MVTLDKQQLKNLIIGVTGIFSIYWASSLLHQDLLKGKFVNSVNNKEEKFKYLLGLVMFPALFTWIAGEIYNTKLERRVAIPAKNSIACAFLIFVSGYTLNLAADKTSYPIVMAVKSSSILAVLLVAVLCTRVRDRNLNLPPRKIIVGIIVTIGILIFGFFDPENKQREAKQEIMGIGLLLASLLADGFLPDFQAEIKSEYKPQPTQMMAEINKCLAILSFVFTLYNFQIWDIILFVYYHPTFLVKLILFSMSGFIGQMFVYRLIKQFKQHIVPFVVTIRKIFTVIINILYYGHQASFLQILGMMIVTGVTVYQFTSEIQAPAKRDQKFEKVTQYQQEIQTDRPALGDLAQEQLRQ